MKAWEKRLQDLANILEQCQFNYNNPNLFRVHINNFLTTSRTITFLIQKNKKEIVDFDEWYKTNVEEKFQKDDLMNWAKNSRNKIQKQGDLEMYSKIHLSIIGSYDQSQDIKIENIPEEALFFQEKRIKREIRKNLPSGLSKNTAIKIERNWIANSLPDREILKAFHEIYKNMYDLCKSLSRQIQKELDLELKKPDDLFFQDRRN